MVELTVEVWWAEARQASADHVRLLDPDERARRAALRQDADRDRFTVGAALLRLVAGADLGERPERVPVRRVCPDCHRPHGKPAVPGSGLELSVSHSGDWVAVAATRAGPTGVDVERVRTDIDLASLARHVLSPAERDWFGAADFFLCWTRKEAVAKATGDGLRLPMPSLTVSRPGDPPRLLLAEGRADLPARTVLRDLRPDPDHCAAVAVLSDVPVAIREHSARDLLTGPG